MDRLFYSYLQSPQWGNLYDVFQKERSIPLGIIVTLNVYDPATGTLDAWEEVMYIATFGCDNIRIPTLTNAHPTSCEDPGASMTVATSCLPSLSSGRMYYQHLNLVLSALNLTRSRSRSSLESALKSKASDGHL